MSSLKEGMEKRRSSPLQWRLARATAGLRYTTTFDTKSQRLSGRAESRCLGRREGQSHQPAALHLGEGQRGRVGVEGVDGA